MKNDDVIVLDDQQKDEPVIVEQSDDGKFKERVTHDGDSIVVKLAHPFTSRYRRNGTEVEETTDKLTFRPVNGGDMRALQSFRDEEEKSIKLFIRLSGLVEAQFDKLRMEDIEFCSEAIDSFLFGGRTTGKK